MFFAGGIICPQASRMCCDTPPFLGKDIPISSFVSPCADVTPVMKSLVGEKMISGARHWNKTCCHRSSCETSPTCRKCLHSLRASISVTVLKAPGTAGFK